MAEETDPEEGKRLSFAQAVKRKGMSVSDLTGKRLCSGRFFVILKREQKNGGTGESILNRRMKGICFILCLLMLWAALPGVLAEKRQTETRRGGRLTETTWVDDAGNPVNGPEGYAVIRYTYKGRDTTEMYFTADGAPFKTAGGYFGRVVSRDGKDRVSGIEYLDAEGNRTLNSLGYGRVTMFFNSFNELRTLKYFGMGKDPVVVPSLGYAMIEADYRGKSMTLWSYLDDSGALTEGPDGYAAVYQKVNAKHKVIRTWYTHANGQPATCPDGWSSSETERDAKERVISVKYYDEAGQLTDRGAGYAWEENRWSGNREVRTTRYGLKGEMIPLKNGAVTLLKQVRDERVEKIMYLDADGNPMTDARGVGGAAYGYDSQGRLESVTWLNETGETTLCADGYAGWRDTRDEKGFVVSRVWMGTDGLPMDRSGGYAEARYAYSEEGVLTGTQYYSASGAQAEPAE